MLNSAKTFAIDIDQFFKATYQRILDLTEETKSTVNLEELADLAFALNESYKYLDELRKNIDKLKKLTEKMACAIWLKNESTEPIRTPYVTATPNMKMSASIPKLSTNPEGYHELMKFLQIPRHVVEKELVRVHWPSFVEYITDLSRNGRSFPPGIDPSKTYPVYSLLLRRTKKEIEP